MSTVHADPERSAGPSGDSGRGGGGQEKTRRGADTWLVLLAAVAAATGTAGAARAVPSPDVSYLLFAADRVLDGARYGVDIIEINPPLIVWLYGIPAGLARAVGAAPYVMLALLTVLLGITCIALASRILRGTRHCVLALTFFAAAAFLLPVFDFGQREHLALLLCLPWVALATVRVTGGHVGLGLVLGAALFGAAGFLLKPYFGLAWLMVELYVVRARGARSLVRTENLVVAACGLLYVAAVVLFAGDFLEFAALLGPAYRRYLAQGTVEAFIGVAGVLLFAVYRARRPPATPMAGAFEAMAAGFLLSAIVQLKWWPYHVLPTVAFAVPALVLAAWGRPAAAGASRLTGRLGVAALMAYLLGSAAVRSVSVATDPWQRRHLSEPFLPEMLAAVEAYGPDGPIAVLSTNIHSAFPLVPLSGADWSGRLPSLWPLVSAYAEQFEAAEGAIRTRPPAERTGVEAWLNEVLLEDLTTRPPRLLFVLRHAPEINDSGGARRIDYLRYLRADARFAAILDRYERIPDAGRYEVWRRVD